MRKCIAKSQDNLNQRERYVMPERAGFINGVSIEIK